MGSFVPSVCALTCGLYVSGGGGGHDAPKRSQESSHGLRVEEAEQKGEVRTLPSRAGRAMEIGRYAASASARPAAASRLTSRR